MTFEELQQAEGDYAGALNEAHGRNADDAILIASAINLLGLRIAQGLEDIELRLNQLIDK